MTGASSPRCIRECSPLIRPRVQRLHNASTRPLITRPNATGRHPNAKENIPSRMGTSGSNRPRQTKHPHRRLRLDETWRCGDWDRNQSIPAHAATATRRHETLSNRDTRSFRKHPGRNVHRHELLEEQLGRIGNMHLRDPRLVLAGSALERILLQIPDVNVSPKPCSVAPERSLTQPESSTRKCHRCAPEKRPTPRIAALSGRHLRRAQSCNRAPSLQNEDHRLWPSPPPAAG